MSDPGPVPVAAGQPVPTGPVGLPDVMTIFIPLDLNTPEGGHLQVTEDFIKRNVAQSISMHYGGEAGFTYDAEILSIEPVMDRASGPGISVTLKRTSEDRPRSVTKPGDVGALGGSNP